MGSRNILMSNNIVFNLFIIYKLHYDEKFILKQEMIFLNMSINTGDNCIKFIITQD